MLSQVRNTIESEIGKREVVTRKVDSTIRGLEMMESALRQATPKKKKEKSDDEDTKRATTARIDGAIASMELVQKALLDLQREKEVYKQRTTERIDATIARLMPVEKLLVSKIQEEE